MGAEQVAALCARFREALKQRGARGMIGLSRRFRIADDDGSRTLSADEFTKCVREAGLAEEARMDAADMALLFQKFDRDLNKRIDFDEFLHAVRGPVAPRRARLVDAAFDLLDANGNGVIEPQEIAGKYDASNHPDVVAGWRSA